MEVTFKVTLQVEQRQEYIGTYGEVPFDAALKAALAEAVDTNLPSSWVLSSKHSEDGYVVIENKDSVVEVLS